MSKADSPGIDLGFAGADEDTETGLDNLVGRIYDPQVGRFISADPFVSDPYWGQSYNRYSYVSNNPMTFTDPTGFQEDYGPGVIPEPSDEDPWSEQPRTPLAPACGGGCQQESPPAPSAPTSPLLALLPRQIAQLRMTSEPIVSAEGVVQS